MFDVGDPKIAAAAAATAMGLSSLLVVTNSLRLGRFAGNRSGTPEA